MWYWFGWDQNYHNENWFVHIVFLVGLRFLETTWKKITSPSLCVKVHVHLFCFIKTLANVRSLTVIAENVADLRAAILCLTSTSLTLAGFLESFSSIFEQSFRSLWYWKELAVQCRNKALVCLSLTGTIGIVSNSFQNLGLAWASKSKLRWRECQPTLQWYKSFYRYFTKLLSNPVLTSPLQTAPLIPFLASPGFVWCNVPSPFQCSEIWVIKIVTARQ